MAEIFKIKKDHRRLLIDGDVLIHMACWQKPIAVLSQLRKLADLEEIRLFEGESSNYLRLKESFDEKTSTIQPTIEKAQARFTHFVNKSLEDNNVTEFSMAIGNPKNNWRLDIHPEYKLHKARTGGKPRAPYMQELREWAVEEFSGHYCDGYEADDAIRIWAEKLGYGNYIICSVDKDLDLIEGPHYSPKEENKSKAFWEVTKEYAGRFFWEQMLTGDSIDNIPGIVGIGPKTAEKLLADCSSIQDCRDMVVKQYALKYGDEGYERLLFNGQLLHIWRKKGDIWTFEKDEYNKITCKTE